MKETAKVDRDVPIAISPNVESRRDGAIHPSFGRKLHHAVPSWVPDGSRLHIRIRVAPEFRPSLTEPEIGTKLLESANLYHARRRWHATIFLLMPDHLHAILSFPSQESMSRVIGEWKRYQTKELGMAWQDNFFDHRLRNDAEANLKYDYICRNPVTKGLCQRPEDWPWFIAL
jgi:putative transposase